MGRDALWSTACKNTHSTAQRMILADHELHVRLITGVCLHLVVKSVTARLWLCLTPVLVSFLPLLPPLFPCPSLTCCFILSFLVPFLLYSAVSLCPPLSHQEWRRSQWGVLQY